MRKILNKIVISGIVFLFGLLMMVTAQAQNAASTLDNAASIYSKSNGISATFTMHNKSEIQQLEDSFEGTIEMKGDKFVLHTPDMITWFDGKTQWTYVERNGEVNVANPSKDDLRFVNPSILLRSYKKDFAANYTGESTASNGKSVYDIELIPKKKGDVLSVELRIDKQTGMPVAMNVVSKNGLISDIRISKIKTDVNQSDDIFVFKAENYPDAEVIDLR